MDDKKFLAEHEVRNIVETELRRTLIEGTASSELCLLVGDALLDGLREIVPVLSRSTWVKRAGADADPRAVVTALLDDTDFRNDLTRLVARILKRSQ